MQRIAENIINTITETQGGDDLRPGEYMGDDGFIHCGTCGGKKQTLIEIKNMGIKNIVRCDCGCGRAEMEKEKELRRLAEQRALREMNRNECFNNGRNMAKWTFENDDRQRPELSDAMRKYADNFKEYRSSGKGLILMGPTGTGKTYLAAAIANRVIDLGYRAYMTNIATAVNILQKTFEKQEYIDELCSYDLLIIDDLGIERQSSFMQEQIYNIIDARYRTGRPFIVTSNLTQTELSQPGEIGNGRVYDRIIERCLPVKVEGESRRRKIAAAFWGDMREELGIVTGGK